MVNVKPAKHLHVTFVIVSISACLCSHLCLSTASQGRLQTLVSFSFQVDVKSKLDVGAERSEINSAVAWF